MTPREFLFLLASSRVDGNTEQLARLAARELPESHTQKWLRLSEYPLAPFVDVRHTEEREPAAPHGNELALLEATCSATDLVFVVPLYWYSVPASAKLYLDYWSAWMRVPGADFKQQIKGKTLWAICTYSDLDLRLTEPLTSMLRHTAGYMGMHWGGALIGFGNRPGEVMRDPDALVLAKSFFTFLPHTVQSGKG